MQLLYILEIVFAILLIVVILIQNKSVSLNLTTMGGTAAQTEKRGAEKFLHLATIVLGIAFIVNSVLLFIYS